MENEMLKSLLKEKLLEFQKLSYEELFQFMDNPKSEKYGEGDDFYQVEMESLWDDAKGETKNLRVMVAIDDGGIKAFSPLTDDFIITPDGKFI